MVLGKGADASACWIESLERGWLFLIPNGPESAWLLSVGQGSEESLAESRVVRKQVAAVGGSNDAGAAVAEQVAAIVRA